MPQLGELVEREEEIGFKLLVFEVTGNLGETRKVLDEKGVSLPVLLDGSHYMRGVLEVQHTPTLLVVDRRGRIRSRIVGRSEDLVTVVEEILTRL